MPSKLSKPRTRTFYILVIIAVVHFINAGDLLKIPEIPSCSIWKTLTARDDPFLPERSGNQTVSERSLSWISSLAQAPLGSMGAMYTEREHLRYYDSLYFLAHQYGANAKSLLEVGCSNNPFANYLNWIEKRVCVAPYFINYGRGKESETNSYSSIVESVKADFIKWKEPHPYDLVLCGQVLEHVPNPRGFLQKLIRTAGHAAVVSVPYMWEHCGSNCGHVNHMINEKTIEKWAAPHKPIYQGVVRESNDKARLIVVFVAAKDTKEVEISQSSSKKPAGEPSQPGKTTQAGDSSQPSKKSHADSPPQSSIKKQADNVLSSKKKKQQENEILQSIGSVPQSPSAKKQQTDEASHSSKRKQVDKASQFTGSKRVDEVSQPGSKKQADEAPRPNETNQRDDSSLQVNKQKAETTPKKDSSHERPVSSKSSIVSENKGIETKDLDGYNDQTQKKELKAKLMKQGGSTKSDSGVKSPELTPHAIGQPEKKSGGQIVEKEKKVAKLKDSMPKSKENVVSLLTNEKEAEQILNTSNPEVSASESLPRPLRRRKRSRRKMMTRKKKRVVDPSQLIAESKESTSSPLVNETRVLNSDTTSVVASVVKTTTRSIRRRKKRGRKQKDAVAQSTAGDPLVREARVVNASATDVGVSAADPAPLPKMARKKKRVTKLASQLLFGNKKSTDKSLANKARTLTSDQADAKLVAEPTPRRIQRRKKRSRKKMARNKKRMKKPSLSRVGNEESTNRPVIDEARTRTKQMRKNIAQKDKRVVKPAL